MSRYPSITPEDMYFEQQRVAEAVDQRRDGGLAGPFIPLVYVPGILDRFQMLGEHCRFNPAIPRKLIELAILITARHVEATFEFHVHTPPARRFGVNDETIEAIAAKRRPSTFSEDEEVVYDFCIEMYATGRVSDDVFERTVKRFGKSVVVDLVATCGYYATLGMVLNVTQMELPADVVPPFPVPVD